MGRQPGLGVGDRAPQEVVRLPLVTVPHPDGPLLLGQQRDAGRELGQPGPGSRHHAQQLQGRHDPVSRRRVLTDDDVTALLAAEARPRDQHCGEDVLVADRGPDEAPAGRLHGLLQAPVRENRHHEAAAVERAAGEPLERQDPEDLVPVHEAPGGIDGDAAVRVPVKGEPHVRPVRPDSVHQGRRIRRAAAAVDVVPVGRVVDNGDPGAGRPQDRRADPAGRPVRRVEDDVKAWRGHRPGQRRPMVHVPPEERHGVHGAADLRGRDAGQLVRAEHQRFQLVLEVVVKLQPGRIEDLQAVVLGGVVRGRHHDPRRERACTREIGERRGRHHPDAVHVDTHAGGARRDRRDEHVAGATRVLAHDERATRADDPVRGRAPEREGQGGAKVHVRGTADAVRAKEAGHWAPRGVGSGRVGVRGRETARPTLSGRWTRPGPGWATERPSAAGRPSR